MISNSRVKLLILSLMLFLLLSSAAAQIQSPPLRSQPSEPIPYEEIIQNGIKSLQTDLHDNTAEGDVLDTLEAWYTLHPLITFASRIKTSMTVKFIDDSYTILLDLNLRTPPPKTESLSPYIHESYGYHSNNTAVLLNSAEHMYGHRQCEKIIATLLRHDYSIEYLANQAVDLSYLKNNLTAGIVYMNTHAGFFDVDGDHQAESVVIATGEFWTNETEEKYAFDYGNKFIVKGMVGDQTFVAFTPAFIEYYYPEGRLTQSLVFMATCYAMYDTSMAEKFLTAGAKVYIGWSGNTVFWTNSKVSVSAFHLLSVGFSVQQVCKLIRSGGLYNWLLHSRLIYHGDGTYRML